jgi:transposase
MRRTALLITIWVFLLVLYCPSFSPPAFCSETRVQHEEPPDRNPPGATYEDIERKIKELIDELEKLRKDAEKKLRKDIVPRLEKELDKLKEWLRDFRLNEKDQPRTRET